jgi:conjugative relaxase-like TrwC/TraI family protein
VLRFATFASARAAVRYFVEHGADCSRPVEPDQAADGSADRAVSYYGEAGRSVGQWAGSGAAGLGLTGPVREGQVRVLERLLSGQLPDGAVVARPVWRPHPDSRLPVCPLLDAVHAAAANRGVEAADLVQDPGARAEFARLSAQAAGDPRPVASLAHLTPVAEAAEVDLAALYGPGRVAVAHAQAGVKVDVRRAGADGAVSAPKSVSLLWAFGDTAVSAEVLAAHRAAADETVKYLERWASHALRGHQGDGQRAARVGTEGLIVAAFEHLTSRADDPQLHTHLVIANLLHGSDGRWSALDTRALFRVQRTAGYLYQAVLRGELTSRLGVGWGPVRNGMAEITGMPVELLREFSTRRRAIEDELSRTGATGVAAAQVACLTTRPAKSGRTVSELRDGWLARARRYLADPQGLVAAVTQRQEDAPLTSDVLARHTDALIGPGGLTARQSGFDRGEVTRALLEGLPTGTPLDHHLVETATDTLFTDDRVLPLLDSGPDRRWTTSELAATEATTLQLAATTTVVPAAPVTVDAPGLTPMQRRVVENIAASTSTVDVLLGPAGSGKTALLAALHTHYRSLDVPVVGACVAAVAARRLEHATAIPSTSLARLLARIRDGQPLPPQCVVVLDEASMVGSRDYHQLLTALTAAGGKLLPVGDRAQLAELTAGGMFARLSLQHLRGELVDNHRQRHGWERAALTTLRAGNIPHALTLYARHDRLHAHPDSTALASAIAEQYLDVIADGVAPDNVVALAATRSTAAALNSQIRHRLQQAGWISPDQNAGERRYAVGEQVMVTRNDHHRGLLNGQRGTITAIHPDRITLDVDGQPVTVPASWANDRLIGAYATTLHKAQGLTVEIALVDATGIGDRNAGYVALSRARERTEIHHTGIDTLTDALADDPVSPVKQRTRPEPTSELAVRLVHIREQRLAIDQDPRWHRPPTTAREGRGR